MRLRGLDALDGFAGSDDDEAVPVIDTADARLHYIVDGAGPPVLLVQGAGLVGEGWRPQIDGLRDRHTVVTLDNRGMGASTRAPGPLTIDGMARDALAVMDALGIARFHLGGHSMGGLIAQALALASPERVLTLALLCTFARGRQAARMTPAMLATSLRMRIGSRAMRREAFLELVMPAAYLGTVDCPALAERLRPLFGYDLASQPAFVMRQVRAMSRYDAGDRLRGLSRIPTLVLSASEDRIAHPGFGRELASLIPGARYVEIPDAGHGVTIQCAGTVNDLLAEHFAKTTSAPVLSPFS